MRQPFNPATLIDAYKFDHRRQYPAGTTRVYSNMTPRGSRLAGVHKVVFFGLQAFTSRVLEDLWAPWFAADEEEVCATYARRTDAVLGPTAIGTDHIRALHRLGYLPLRFCALAEGTEVPLRIPVFTVENTHHDFAWLVNYVETVLSAETWLPATSATQAVRLRRLLDGWAEQTSSVPEMVDWQGHDFSFRGMASLEAAAASGAGHLLAFAGTDSLVSLDWIDAYYPRADGQRDGLLGGSVAATEHSVMCAGGEEGEAETFARLLDLYPGGIVSIVSDTWDLWEVLTDILPGLRDRVMARDGKVVIRPDSGDPVDILCGDAAAPSGSPASKGVVEVLWELFSGATNSKGYRELDPHIGAIYGDSITYERAGAICERLAAKGFASTNVVLGVGSFTYQYVTRDTFGFAMKATWAEVDGAGRNLSKNPATDSGIKRSAKGRLAVFANADGGLGLVEEASAAEEAASLLRPVWEDGKPLIVQTWDEIVTRVGLRRA